MLTARNLEGVKPQLQGREREREKLRERRRGGEGKSVRAWRQVEPSASPSLSVTHTHTHGGGRKGRGEQIRGAAKKRGRVESNHTSKADHCQPKNTSRVGRRTMIEEQEGGERGGQKTTKCEERLTHSSCGPQTFAPPPPYTVLPMTNRRIPPSPLSRPVPERLYPWSRATPRGNTAGNRARRR